MTLFNINLLLDSLSNNGESYLYCHHLRTVKFNGDINITILGDKSRYIVTGDYNVEHMVVINRAGAISIILALINRDQ